MCSLFILVPLRGSTPELKVTTRKGGDKGTWLGNGFKKNICPKGPFLLWTVWIFMTLKFQSGSKVDFLNAKKKKKILDIFLLTG